MPDNLNSYGSSYGNDNEQLNRNKSVKEQAKSEFDLISQRLKQELAEINTVAKVREKYDSEIKRRQKEIAENEIFWDAQVRERKKKSLDNLYARYEADCEKARKFDEYLFTQINAKENAEEAKNALKRIENSIKYYQNESKYASKHNIENKEEIQRLNAEKIKSLEKEYNHLKSLQKKAAIQAVKTDLQNAKQKSKDIEADYKQRLKYSRKFFTDDKNEARKRRIEELKENVANLKKIRDEAIQNGNALQIQSANNELTKAEHAAKGAESKQRVRESLGMDTAEHFMQSFEKVAEKFTAKFESYLSTYSQYMSQISTRLQGSSESYQNIQEDIMNTLASSAIVTQKTMIENVNKLTEAGVAYNVEQRAFLSSVSDRIASTFDAANGTLLRIVRMQAEDSTAARLGMESSINTLLNSMYSDSSYLSDEYKNVTDILLEATSTMSTALSTEFEYTVQKWLGSLYSMGISSSAVSSIAQGISYVGSGNVGALANNTPLQTLIAMSASKSGLDYGQLLTNGLNTSDTNKLLRSMVEYLSEIAENDNQVVKSQYAEILGLSLSDLNSLKKISAATLNDIARQELSYSQAVGQTVAQLNDIETRTHISTMMDNVVENMLTTVSSNISSSTGKYVAYKVMDIVEDVTGGIAVPAISVLGNMVDLETTVTQVGKAAIFGTGVIGEIGNIISSFGQTLSGNDKAKNLLGNVYNISTNKYGTGVNTSSGIQGLTSSISAIEQTNYNIDEITDQNEQEVAAKQNKNEKKSGGLFSWIKNKNKSETTQTSIKHEPDEYVLESLKKDFEKQTFTFLMDTPEDSNLLKSVNKIASLIEAGNVAEPVPQRLDNISGVSQDLASTYSTASNPVLAAIADLNAKLFNSKEFVNVSIANTDDKVMAKLASVLQGYEIDKNGKLVDGQYTINDLINAIMNGGVDVKNINDSTFTNMANKIMRSN